uniref:Uncharacterized protein n=1 Tax=Aegilops tauschii subsp. strangulata TaxID=200361 RepID=A0A453H316_AEGTS
MALLKLPGIGCSSILAGAGSRCLAAASHAPSSSPVFLLHANGGGGGQAHLLSRKTTTGDAMRTRRRDLHVVATAAASAANVTPASPRGVSASDVLWPSAGESARVPKPPSSLPLAGLSGSSCPPLPASVR